MNKGEDGNRKSVSDEDPMEGWSEIPNNSRNQNYINSVLDEDPLEGCSGIQNNSRNQICINSLSDLPRSRSSMPEVYDSTN